VSKFHDFYTHKLVWWNKKYIETYIGRFQGNRYRYRCSDNINPFTDGYVCTILPNVAVE
jgi:hypothetical protein